MGSGRTETIWLCINYDLNCNDKITLQYFFPAVSLTQLFTTFLVIKITGWNMCDTLVALLKIGNYVDSKLSELRAIPIATDTKCSQFPLPCAYQHR